MPEKVEATQYYPSDLAEYLDLGEIIEMRVEDNGRGTKVLRIISRPKVQSRPREALEFKTVSPKRLKGGSSRTQEPRETKPTGPKKGIIGGALTAMFGDDYRNQKPPWMD
jgi:hypothetical protein